MIFKKILWILKRHPFLYRCRFWLLSKNSNINELKDCCYNQLNSKEQIPEYFNEINDKIFPEGIPDLKFDRVKKITSWLLTQTNGGPGLSVPSDIALKMMLSSKQGVCSDMAQVFNNFCVINDVRVREWGSTRAPFDKKYGGHSFNEVFIDELDKWVLVDVYYGIIFYFNEDPLSVIELFELFRKGKKISFGSYINFEVNTSSIYRNYLNANAVPFLICNYSNKTYDAFLSYTRPYIPVFITHFVLYVINKSYHYKFPINNYRDLF